MSDEVQSELVSEGIATLTIGIPDVPGGAVTIPFVEDGEEMRVDIVRALKLAAYTREKFLGTFPHMDRETTPPAPQRTDAPPRGQERPQGAAAYCPDHDNAPCRFSAPRFNKDGDRLYHPLPQAQWTKDDRGGVVKNHSLYWRQTVDANGESNDGKIIPQGQASS